MRTRSGWVAYGVAVTICSFAFFSGSTVPIFTPEAIATTTVEPLRHLLLREVVAKPAFGRPAPAWYLFSYALCGHAWRRPGLRRQGVGARVWLRRWLMGRAGRSESVRALKAAMDSGITFFDTARSYGYGESESLLFGRVPNRTSARGCAMHQVRHRSGPSERLEAEDQAARPGSNPSSSCAAVVRTPAGSGARRRSVFRRGTTQFVRRKFALPEDRLCRHASAA